MPSRRAFLAATGMALASGCSALQGCRWGTTLRATPAAEIDLYIEEPTGPRRDLVETAIREGHVEVSATRGARPFGDGRIVAHDGTYYEARLADADEAEIPALVVNVRARGDEESVDDADVLAYDSLPAADRRALGTVALGPEHWFWDADERPTPSARLDARDTSMPYPGGLGDSALREAGEAWVDWGDHHYRVEVLREGTTTQETLRYELEEVGTTREAVRRHVIPDDPIQFDDLSADERAVMDEAVEGEYEACEEEPPELEAIADRLLDHDGSHGHTPNEVWYVAYEGSIYEVSLDVWGSD